MSQFKSEQHPEFNLIRCPDTLGPEECKEFETQAKATWMNVALPYHVLDFTEVSDLPGSAYRTFLQYKQLLKARHVKLLTINVDPKIRSKMKADGVEDVFTPVENLATYINPPKTASEKPKLDIDFVNIFLNAAKQALEVQACTPLKLGKPMLKKSAPKINVSLAAVLSIDSEKFTGCLALNFPKEVFLRVYENMLGEKHTDITQEIQDAGAELLNIIFGMAKRSLNDEKGFSLQKAIPTVVTGQNLELPITSQARLVIVIPCETDAGPLHLEILLGPFKM